MTTKEKYENIQKIFTEIGKSGCYFLCLMSIIEEWANERQIRIDFLNILRVALSEKWLRYDMWVENPLKILSFATGRHWSLRKENVIPIKIESNEYTVLKYQMSNGRTHFRRRGFDVWENSTTVREGRMVNCYVFTII